MYNFLINVETVYLNYEYVFHWYMCRTYYLKRGNCQIIFVCALVWHSKLNVSDYENRHPIWEAIYHLASLSIIKNSGFGHGTILNIFEGTFIIFSDSWQGAHCASRLIFLDAAEIKICHNADLNRASKYIKNKASKLLLQLQCIHILNTLFIW